MVKANLKKKIEKIEKGELKPREYPKKKVVKKKEKESIDNTIKDNIVKDALKISKKPIQRLGQGLHKDIFYYGTTLTYEGKPVSAVITSDKKLYLGVNIVNWKCDGCYFSDETTQPSYEKIIPPKT